MVTSKATHFSVQRQVVVAAAKVVKDPLPPHQTKDDSVLVASPSNPSRQDLVKPRATNLLNNEIPRSLEKPQKIQSYDETGDLDEHIEHMDNQLDYYHAHRAIKCKLFALTLPRSAMFWLKTLSDGSMDSCQDLCEALTTNFTPKEATHNNGYA
ncbi:unnamed protein product [Vicia faba]|uniref:Retrotransposon gag domain-containing protein n=1 Tax=Vicia faba TaxID=3906 RepID=A0AAV0YZC1_VICFA|nr:unnamed protein product [Vicia faba]